MNVTIDCEFDESVGECVLTYRAFGVEITARAPTAPDAVIELADRMKAERTRM